jgi:purine catabolism regulator
VQVIAQKSAPVEQADTLRLTLEITNILLNAVSMADPVKALVGQVAALCHGAAVVYGADGVIVESAGEAPTQLIWNEVSASHVTDQEFSIGRWQMRARTVALHDGVHVLAIGSRREDVLPLLGDVLLDTAERMLGAVNGIQYGATQRDRRNNEHMLATLQDGVLPSREHRHWGRLSQFNFSAYVPLRAIEAAMPGGEPTTEAHVQRLADSAKKLGVALLISIRKLDQQTPATINAIIPAVGRGEAWLNQAAQTLTVGTSAVFGALAETPAAFREAETALEIARSRARSLGADAGSTVTTEIVRLDDVDLGTWLLSQVDGRQATARIRSIVDPLRGAETLNETLVTYLALDQNIVATAQAMFVHANTIRYRLSKIEELFGEAVTSASFVTNLYLSLQNAVLGRQRALANLRNASPDA